MKNKIWFFGCSHSTGAFNLNSPNDCWTTKLADKFNFDEVNKAVPGSSNDEILSSIIYNLSCIGPDDLIIVLFTHPHRIRYDNCTLVPSKIVDQWFYKTVSADDFYYYKLLHIVLSTKYLLSSHNYMCSFADPSILLKQFYNQHIKNLIIDSRTVLLPKLTLSNSFPLGDDSQHLSSIGHDQMFKFFSNLLAEQV